MDSMTGRSQMQREDEAGDNMLHSPSCKRNLAHERGAMHLVSKVNLARVILEPIDLGTLTGKVYGKGIGKAQKHPTKCSKKKSSKYSKRRRKESRSHRREALEMEAESTSKTTFTMQVTKQQQPKEKPNTLAYRSLENVEHYEDHLERKRFEEEAANSLELYMDESSYMETARQNTLGVDLHEEASLSKEKSNDDEELQMRSLNDGLYMSQKDDELQMDATDHGLYMAQEDDELEMDATDHGLYMAQEDDELEMDATDHGLYMAQEDDELEMNPTDHGLYMAQYDDDSTVGVQTFFADSCVDYSSLGINFDESQINDCRMEMGRTIRDISSGFMDRYYPKGGYTVVKSSMDKHFWANRNKGKHTKPTFENVGTGAFGAQFVVMEGEKKFVLKESKLPEVLFDDFKFVRELDFLKVKTFKGDRLRRVVLDTDKMIADKASYSKTLSKLKENLTIGVTKNFDKQIAPFYTGANREKFARIIGKRLGLPVPKVEILKTNAGRVYSCHEYVPNTKMLSELSMEEIRGLDPQKVQELFVFDALLMNVDRNSGNILITEDGDLIPIDHSLSLQGSRNDKEQGFYTVFFNGSLRSMPMHADVPLSQASKQKIQKFSARVAIAEAKQKGLTVDPDVARRLEARDKRAKKLAITIPNITVRKFMYAVTSEKCFAALQLRPSYNATDLFRISNMKPRAFKDFITNLEEGVVARKERSCKLLFKQRVAADIARRATEEPYDPFRDAEVKFLPSS